MANFHLSLNLNAVKPDANGLYPIEIIRCGRWDYPEPGTFGFEITPDTIKELNDNFHRGLMGNEVVLNIDHKKDTDCGWVKDTFIGKGGRSLFGLVDITEPDVRSKVENGTLKFASAELDFSRVCPELSASGDDAPRKVLEGLALTNHPYVKGMLPVGTYALCDKAHLDASGAHYPAAQDQLAVDYSGRPDNELSDEDPAKEGTMPENNTQLAEKDKEIAELKAKLAERESGQTVAQAALAEAREAKAALKLREIEESVKSLVRRGKVPPMIGRRLLSRIIEPLVRGGSDLITLATPLKNSDRKFRLAEDDKDDMDKLDVVKEVVDMLGQLPDAVAMDPAGANLSEEDEGQGSMSKDDDDEAEKKAADEAQKDDPKLSRREAYAIGRKKLAEKRGGKK